MSLRSQRLISVLSLFSSSGTLICCAIPAALVAIGAGASLAGLISVFPQIVWFSEQKVPIFAVSGVLIAASLFMTWKNRNAPCPIDKQQAVACQRLKKWSFINLSIAILFYVIGASFAFIFPFIQG